MCAMKIENKIICVGVVTLVLALLGVALSVYAIIQWEQLDQYNQGQREFKHSHLLKNVTQIMNSSILIVSALAAIFSILLIVGIKKNNKEFLVAYFTYGKLIVIILLTIGLLRCIGGFWRRGIGMMFLAVNYSYGLNTVYKGYEMMLNGVVFGDSYAALLENVE